MSVSENEDSQKMSFYLGNFEMPVSNHFWEHCIIVSYRRFVDGLPTSIDVSPYFWVGLQISSLMRVASPA